MFMQVKKIFYQCLPLAVLAMFLSSCSLIRPIDLPPVSGPGGFGSSTDGPAGMKKFSSTEDFLDFFVENQPHSNFFSYGAVNDLAVNERALKMETGAADASAAPGLPMPSAAEQAGGGASDYSRTNVQVAGVDEADIVKTDGRYIYALAKQDLYIIEAYPPAKAGILARIAFRDRPSEIFLRGDKLIVIGERNVYQPYYYDYQPRLFDEELMIDPSQNGISSPEAGVSSQETTAPAKESLLPDRPLVFCKVFDLADKKAPRQLKSFHFSGQYTDARLIDDQLYLLSNINSFQGEWEEFLPKMWDNEKETASHCAGSNSCYAPGLYYFDLPYNGYNLTVVNSLDLGDLDKSVQAEAYLLPSGQNIYVSRDNLYLTFTQYLDEYSFMIKAMRAVLFPRLSARLQDRLKKIESADRDILREEEKMRKIGELLEGYASRLGSDERKKLEAELEQKTREMIKSNQEEREKTIIHKISLEQGKITHQAQGAVPGLVLNQFSMDEKDGYFRVATTKSRQWSSFAGEEEESSTNVFVLDKNLALTGRVTGLAPGEQIYSVRFLGQRAYLVTFKQMDPLFTIDLSDPRNPRVLGALKIPGFSNYLHPYDENTLIGIGKETKENSSGGFITQGLKISLFDVSDVSHPQELAKYVLNYTNSDSIALYDHKAFLFSREKNLLAIPASYSSSFNSILGRYQTFSGALVFDLSRDQIRLRGEVDHSNGQDSKRDFWGGINYYDNSVRRCLYIGDSLYTLSNNYLKINDLADLADKASLDLRLGTGAQDDDFQIFN